jgi:hypothetical protein
MVIAQRGTAQTNASFDGAPFNVNEPAGIVLDDVILGIVHSQYLTYADLTIPSGFTFLDGRDSGGSGGNSKLCYRVAPSAGGPHSFSASSNGSHVSASLFAFSGVPLSGGVPTFVVAKSTNSNDDIPSVNAPGSADMLVGIVISDHDSGSARTYTFPGSMTEIMESGWNYMSHAIGIELLSASGATGTRDVVAVGSVDRQHQYAIAISSGGGGGSGPGEVVAVPATATATAHEPAVAGDPGVGVITAVPAGATAEALPPTVSGTSIIEGGGPATATAQAHPPTVSGSGGSTGGGQGFENAWYSDGLTWTQV